MDKILIGLFVIAIIVVGILLPTAGAIILCVGCVAAYLILRGG